jgi:hypothetical protein
VTSRYAAHSRGLRRHDIISKVGLRMSTRRCDPLCMIAQPLAKERIHQFSWVDVHSFGRGRNSISPEDKFSQCVNSDRNSVGRSPENWSYGMSSSTSVSRLVRITSRPSPDCKVKKTWEPREAKSSNKKPAMIPDIPGTQFEWRTHTQACPRV